MTSCCMICTWAYKPSPGYQWIVKTETSVGVKGCAFVNACIKWRTQPQITKLFNTPIFCYCFPSGSEVKASACNAGDLGSIPGSGRSPGEGNILWLSSSNRSLNFPSGSVVVNLPANAGDTGLIPDPGRSPGEENGNPLQYSSLEIPQTKEPGGLQSMGKQKSWQDLVIKQQQ